MTALSLVQSAVKTGPERPAIRYLRPDRTLASLTYRQVWELSGRLAARLQGRVLAVAIDDGPYLSLAELAGWRRGMVIVPLDPHDPVSRLQHVAAEAEASCIVAKDWGDAKKLSAVGPVLDLSAEVPLPTAADGAACAGGAAAAGAACEAELDPEAPAYMWFTSGSTGQPKGVLVSHRAFHNWCVVKNDPHKIGRDSVVLIASASTFDPSIGDIFATWAAGGVVAVAPRMLFFANLGWAINQLKVTHVTCTPSLWMSLEAGAEVPTLTTLCVGGERSPQPLLDEWAPKLALLNTYGTTECTVWQTLRRMQAGDRATLVGQPYPGNELRILERDGEADVACGEAGEIVQGGVQVGLGYHRRPELTAQRFVTLPGSAGRWYRTGDGGRLGPDGVLEVMGRFDSQVKIRGMRVELGDIETGVVKASAGLLSNCAVVLRDSFLHAYCQLSESAAVMLHEPFCILPVVSDFLLQRASLELPRHMLPSRFVLMQRLPLTPNGKVDTKKLPEVVDVSTKATSSLTSLERIVASVWSDVLGRTGIGPNDHFLALGGHSMSVLQVSRRLLALAAATGQDVSPATPLAVLLSPEKLIHSPRLRIYCQMLARGGVRLLDASAGTAVSGLEDEAADEEAQREEAAKLRINYVKHKVVQKEAKAATGGYAAAAGAENGAPAATGDPELDHFAWEQVPSGEAGELLCRSAEGGLVPLVGLLLAEGAPVEGVLTGQYLRHGNTPLFLAALGNHPCCAEELIARGADAKRRDAHGTPVLHKAAERCGARMVEILLKAGAEAEAVDSSTRSTALHAAVKAGNADTVRTLLPVVGLDWLDRWNRTALHWAVYHGHAEICRALLAAGARLEGSVAERGGRFLLAAEPSSDLPKRVARNVQSFVTPERLAQERFPAGGPIVELLLSWREAASDGACQDPGRAAAAVACA
eukprot:TRINITY_DN30849_c0_g1_i1.p1 TRINITY_DN30849_c0_g1~~TRINITY_DN30849_c0_g1_i1.p1  ORF type:complete len:929 (+),score=226.59 TRINITY_DN30849_c0_g1_i1:118-2904(+)